MEFRCKICAGSLTVDPMTKMAVCDYCGAKQTIGEVESASVGKRHKDNKKKVIILGSAIVVIGLVVSIFVWKSKTIGKTVITDSNQKISDISQEKNSISESELEKMDVADIDKKEDEKQETDEGYELSKDVTDFFGIWCAESDYEDDLIDIANTLKNKGFFPKIICSYNWDNLDSSDYYIVTAGIYSSKDEANATLINVQEYFPNAYVKYTGDYLEKGSTKVIDMSHIELFATTSSLVWNNIEYSAEQIADGTLDKAWQEGVEGFGEGESITICFDDTYIVRGMKINAGYQKNEKLYYENGRPRDIILNFSDGTMLAYTLDDYCDLQTIEFDEKVETSYVKITIASVYEGTKYQDTSISEVYFF